jgi:hypothetical protein
MSVDKKTSSYRVRSATKRVLTGETREEEAARLAKEIAAHPVPGANPGSITRHYLGRVGAASHSFRNLSGQSPRELQRR